MHIYLHSLDGQWRWSPPGRLRVDNVAADCERHALVQQLLRRARVKGEFFLSLDGRSILPPDSPLALSPGCCVRLLSPPREVEVTLPAPPALFHLLSLIHI